MASADLLLHPVRLRIVQAFLGERAEGFADRGAAEGQALHQLALVDDRTGRELEGDDQVADAEVRLVAERARALERREDGDVHTRILLIYRAYERVAPAFAERAHVGARLVARGRRPDARDAGPGGAHVRVLLRSDDAMKNLNARAWLALAVLAVVMGLLLFVPAGTVHYWQAWVYLSIFTGASVLTTLYLMRKDPALL